MWNQAFSSIRPGCTFSIIRGPSLSVRGPLNIARPVQGWPVIVQAGSSEPGRQLAAETAEVVFAAESSLAAGQKLYADIKGRMRAIGRDPNHLKILPAAFVVVGDSVEAAQAKRAHLDSLVHYDSGIASLNGMLGDRRVRLRSGRPPAGDPGDECQQERARSRVIEAAREKNLTIRQLAQRAGSYSGLAFVGTAKTIADGMEEWLLSEGSDGFNIMFPMLPEGLDDFVQAVVPELQRRGLFRTDYEGRTLRENLGLPRPANRFFPD